MIFKLRHVLAALGFHALIFVFLFASAFFHRKIETPTVIEGVLVEDPRVARQQKLEEERRVQEELQRQKREAEQKLQQEQERVRKEQERKQAQEQARRQEEQKKLQREQDELKKQEQLRLQAEAERKRQEENARKQEEARKKREAEELKRQIEDEQKRREEEERKRLMEEERRRLEEIKRQRDLEEKRRRDALAAQLAAEQAAFRAGKQADWGARIAARIRKFWSRPPGSPDRFNCLVRVEQLPGGDVVSATVVRSCGNPALDRSVEAAVLKASPLPPPDDPSLFERTLNVTFCPAEKACD